MVTADTQHVAYRLKELLGWADYIVDSLCRDQNYESGKIEVLGRITGEDSAKSAASPGTSARSFTSRPPSPN
jgi:hypothetical protein